MCQVPTISKPDKIEFLPFIVTSADALLKIRGEYENTQVTQIEFILTSADALLKIRGYYENIQVTFRALGLHHSQQLGLNRRYDLCSLNP